ncbi:MULTISPECIES: hypothetical protein [unclassified Okeania]|nr:MULTISPECIES: hypothetical protein [unclassified Okeania]NES78064.1 hypothetical protein [Okeania sp. SIO1H4]NET13700.1 hypothetical protein [Okeania sp. SIO1H6]NET22574.1 hypothetical protein [Okeania sp. SIO1H5]NET95685.1 hypothetical protein [Okeania sp. SIO1H2]
MYDTNLNDLGVRSQESGVRREERRRNRSRKRKFFSRVNGIENQKKTVSQ